MTCLDLNRLRPLLGSEQRCAGGARGTIASPALCNFLEQCCGLFLKALTWEWTNQRGGDRNSSGRLGCRTKVEGEGSQVATDLDTDLGGLGWSPLKDQLSYPVLDIGLPVSPTWASAQDEWMEGP